MPVHDTAAFLPELLDSLRAQTFTAWELLAVDDGSTDGSGELLDRAAADDPRVRVLHQPNAGQGAARNRALPLVRGEFLTFCDSDDTLPPHAYAVMVESLQRSGSDLVIGGARRTFRGVPSGVMCPQVHQQLRTGVDVSSFGPVLRDIIACNRMYRTEFWNRAVGTFETRRSYEDHLPMLLSTVRASRIDLLPETTYRWRIREDGTSTSQQKASLRDLTERVSVLREAHAVLSAEQPPVVVNAWLVRALDVDLPQYLRLGVDAEDEYRQALREVTTWLRGLADPGVLALVKQVNRVSGALVTQDRWADLAHHLATPDHVRFTPASVEGRELLVDAPLVPDGVDDLVPMAAMRALAPMETDLVASVSWLGAPESGGPDVLTVAGCAFVPGLADHLATVSVNAVSGDRRVPLEVTRTPSPLADTWARDQRVPHPDAGFVVTVDLARLPGPQPWHLEVTVARGDFSRTATVRRATPGSTATSWPDDGLTGTGWRARLDRATGLTLTRPAASTAPTPGTDPVVTDLELVEGDDGAPTLALHGAAADLRLHHRGRSVAGQARQSSTAVPATLVPLTLAGTPLPVGVWTPEPPVVAAPALARRLPLTLGTTTRRLAAEVNRSGHLTVRVLAPLTDQEASPAGQRHLQRQLPGLPGPEAGTVLFWTGTPTSADVWREVSRTLAEERPGTRQVWGVRDHSEPVPPHVAPVVVDSAAWYRHLASAGHVFSDTEPPAWVAPVAGRSWTHLHVPREDERRGLSTLGAPGRAAEPFLITDRVRQLAALWTQVAVVSAEDIDPVRADYGWEGPVEVTGDPRTDLLLDVDRARESRDRVRSQLGLGRDDVAVGYFPVRRIGGPGATRPTGMSPELPLAALAKASRVRMVRRGADWRRPSGTVVDASTMPWPSDLLCALDHAIVETTDLRFLWPVLERGTLVSSGSGQGRPEPAEGPGPVVSGVEEAARWLRDPEALLGEARARTDAWRRRHHPLLDGRCSHRLVALLPPG